MKRQLKPHPLAEMIPPATEAEVAALATDLQARGLITPILLFEAMILDGRTRLRACELVGVAPRFDEYKGDDPVGAVAALNVRGRSLNESQRSLLGAQIVKAWSANWHSDGASPETQNRNWHLKGDLAEMAAQLVNVSRRSVFRARSLLDAGNEALVARVFRGELAVSKALSSAKPARAKREPSRERLADKLRVEIEHLDQVLRDACGDRVVRVMLEERLQDFSAKLYSYADGSAYRPESEA